MLISHSSSNSSPSSSSSSAPLALLSYITRTFPLGKKPTTCIARPNTLASPSTPTSKSTSTAKFKSTSTTTATSNSTPTTTTPMTSPNTTPRTPLTEILPSDTDAECWQKMLQLQRLYHCYHSARLEAAVEAWEQGGTAAIALIPSRLCLDLLNAELQAKLDASPSLSPSEYGGACQSAW